MRRSFLLALLMVSVGAHESSATDLAAYFPTEVGRTWHYATTKHSKLTAESDSRHTEKRGAVAETVRGPSEHATVAIARTVTEENSTMGQVRIESVVHVRIAPDSIAVAAIQASGQSKIRTLSPPQPLLLQEVPGPTVVGAQGSLRLTTRLEVQSSSQTEVPLGAFADCIATETTGPVSGSLNGVPLRRGSIAIKAWYARGVGLVREERTLQLILMLPNGTSVKVEEVATKVLEARTPP